MKELTNVFKAIFYKLFPNAWKVEIPPVTDWPIFADFAKVFSNQPGRQFIFNGNFEQTTLSAKLKYSQNSVKLVLKNFSTSIWAFDTIIIEFCTTVPAKSSKDVRTFGSNCNVYHVQVPWDTRIHAVFLDLNTHQLNDISKAYDINLVGHQANKTLLMEIGTLKDEHFWFPISLDEKHNYKLAAWDDYIISAFAQHNRPLSLKSLGLEHNIAVELVDYINETIKDNPIEIGTGKQKKFLTSLRISSFKKSLGSFLIKPHFEKDKVS